MVTISTIIYYFFTIEICPYLSIDHSNRFEGVIKHMPERNISIML